MKKKENAVKRRKARFQWSQHHFINHNLALDFVNTVVYRNRPERREDRLASLASVRRWCQSSGWELQFPTHSNLKQILTIRETIDRFFRHAACSGEIDHRGWTLLARLYAVHAPASGLARTRRGLRWLPLQERPRRAHFLSQLLHSAVELTFLPEFSKLKICPGCGWLFIDHTRNGAKRWCISSLCGNRSKTHRHYLRKRMQLRLTAVSPLRSSSPP